MTRPPGTWCCGATAGRVAGAALALHALAALAVAPALAQPAVPPAAGAHPTTTLRLARVFGEHMVLQRGQPIALWGWAAPGHQVIATLAGHSSQARVARDGRWRLQLPALPAGGPHRLDVRAKGPAGQGAETLQLNDLLIGDVWLAGGQSNMAWPLAESQDGVAEAAAADAPSLREMRVPNVAALRPQADLPDGARWQVDSPATAGGFSAVGWHFARRWQATQPRLADGQPVPVGLITTAWNGSHLETWLPREAALRRPDLADAVRATPAEASEFRRARLAALGAVVQRWQPGLPWQDVDSRDWMSPTLDDGAWPQLQTPGPWEGQGLPGVDGVVWLRRSVTLSAEQVTGAAQLSLGAVDDCDDTYVNGQRVGGQCGWDLPRRYTLPPGLLKPGRNVLAVRVTDTGGGGGLHGDAALLRLDTHAAPVPLAGAWRARVAQLAVADAPTANDAPALAHNAIHQPLQGLPLRGVLWYQGESNVPRAAAYASLLRDFITDWRQRWGQPALPFYWVQLAAFRPLADNDVNRAPWAELREAQRQALALPHTGMAVATDVGDELDIHPRDKRTVGQRLAALALHDAGLGPRGAEAPTGPQLRDVQRQGHTLVARFTHTAGGLATRPAGSALQGLSIAGVDGRFVPAQGRIDAEKGDRLIAWSDAVPQPRWLRYGWVDNPAQANLVDGRGLPASPWRSDALPLVTRGVGFAP
ncbi:sialate O-acetylesterase [Ideonella sp. DXS22W]|uniref:Sialate O-acetylesterase n=1 Tax=Pseudaquabacterium inlustre TaxID=2984192 RepID=A0ABU9CM90_9BURK